jgi:hypothetical protein
MHVRTKANNYWLDDGQVKPLNIKTKKLDKR